MQVIERPEVFRPVVMPRAQVPVVRPAETENMLTRAQFAAKPNQYADEPLTHPALAGVRK